MDIRGHVDGDMRSPAGSVTYAHLSSRGERKRDEATILSEHLQRQASVDPSPDPIVPAKAKSGGHGPVRYRECLKNHAANIGGNVVDGCGEFMAQGVEGTLEALKCAACECHRNFHRKEVEGEPHDFMSSSTCHRQRMNNNVNSSPILPLPLPSPMFHHPAAGMVTPMSVAYCGGTESSSEDLNNNNNSNAYVAAPCSYSTGGSVKKRSRTKFTPEQKQRMMEFADKVGWRFQRQDEEEIDAFCGEVGVKRQVFKVWMHNNKNAMKKTTSTSTTLDVDVDVHVHDHHATHPTISLPHHHHAPTPTTTTTLM